MPLLRAAFGGFGGRVLKAVDRAAAAFVNRNFQQERAGDRPAKLHAGAKQAVFERRADHLGVDWRQARLLRNNVRNAPVGAQKNAQHDLAAGKIVAAD